MTVSGHRCERVAEEIYHEMSLMLTGELKDPRLAAAVSVTEVRMTPDMRTVRVYIQFEGDEGARERAMDGLKAASGFVRHELTERLHLRRSPEVLFVPDTSEEYGHRIDELLKKIKQP